MADVRVERFEMLSAWHVVSTVAALAFVVASTRFAMEMRAEESDCLDTCEQQYQEECSEEHATDCASACFADPVFVQRDTRRPEGVAKARLERWAMRMANRMLVRFPIAPRRSECKRVG